MAKTVTLDELHLTFRIPNDLPDDQAEAIRRVLAGDDFMTRLRKAIREVVRAFPELRNVRTSLTR
jgi:hypothetical protein